mmetsp:Transcript_29042/g.89011  ORF Transcript_29042/g.89011 Transcript_29042/m.89011 type:complete len:225 (+) Transcript_29042:923-1597(+)
MYRTWCCKKEFPRTRMEILLEQSMCCKSRAESGSSLTSTMITLRIGDFAVHFFDLKAEKSWTPTKWAAARLMSFRLSGAAMYTTRWASWPDAQPRFNKDSQHCSRSVSGSTPSCSCCICSTGLSAASQRSKYTYSLSTAERRASNVAGTLRAPTTPSRSGRKKLSAATSFVVGIGASSTCATLPRACTPASVRPAKQREGRGAPAGTRWASACSSVSWTVGREG